MIKGKPSLPGRSRWRSRDGVRWSSIFLFPSLEQLNDTKIYDRAFSARFKNRGYCRGFGKSFIPPTLLSQFNTGQSLPPFQLSTLQGAKIHPNEWEGRVPILNFWPPDVDLLKKKCRLWNVLVRSALQINEPFWQSPPTFAQEKWNHFGSNSAYISISSWMNRMNALKREWPEIAPQL